VKTYELTTYGGHDAIPRVGEGASPWQTGGLATPRGTTVGMSGVRRHGWREYSGPNAGALLRPGRAASSDGRWR